ncbi:MAG: hypothetical protein CMJ70_17155 [Planctomycetaceae bacterium]|nr:hypothetical protein [Planctomycetaceae bacterium]HAA70534.1 hypothetical protein [Planctomycetaceae bacterium]
MLVAGVGNRAFLHHHPQRHRIDLLLQPVPFRYQLGVPLKRCGIRVPLFSLLVLEEFGFLLAQFLGPLDTLLPFFLFAGFWVGREFFARDGCQVAADVFQGERRAVLLFDRRNRGTDGFQPGLFRGEC